MKYVKKFENFNVGMTNEDFLGLGKKIKQLISNAKLASEKALNSMSDEDKEEALKFAQEKGFSPESAQKVINTVDKNQEEVEKVVSETNEGVLKDKIISRLSTLVGAPVSLISGLALISGSAQGWASQGWTSKIHDVIEPMLGQGSGPLGVLLFFLTFVFLLVGILKWKTAK